ALIIAYSHCIAHGIDMTKGMQNQKAAVDSGQWLLYRYNPALEATGENPLVLDSRSPKLPLEQYMNMENRFKMLSMTSPEKAGQLLAEAQQDVNVRWKMYEYLSARPIPGGAPGAPLMETNGYHTPSGVPKTATIEDHVLLPSRPLKRTNGQAGKSLKNHE
ncbi:MAG: hypothetical protein ABIQ44_06125, partial [Chloroflexia bacterium]